MSSPQCHFTPPLFSLPSHASMELSMNVRSIVRSARPLADGMHKWSVSVSWLQKCSYTNMMCIYLCRLARYVGEYRRKRDRQDMPMGSSKDPKIYAPRKDPGSAATMVCPRSAFNMAMSTQYPRNRQVLTPLA